MTRRPPTSRGRSAYSRRTILKAGAAGLWLGSGVSRLAAQTTPKKLVFAHVNPPPESAAGAFAWMAQEIRERSKGGLQMEFYGATLLNKELEIINAVKTGNIAVGTPAGAAATVFPELGVFLVPYLVRSYDQAYRLFNGPTGEKLDAQFQQKYNVKILCFFDYGFRHFWNSKRPIVEPKDLRGMKLRVQQAKVFADTINGLGANAVPMPWAEVIPAAQQGVIDGGDLPVVNILALKAYEVSKYCSMTYHNYAPSVVVANLDVWNNLTAEERTLILDVSREAQARIRHDTESVDNFDQAKALLEPKGMIVNQADVEAFRQIARDKIWPLYQKPYAELWEQIDKTQS